MNGHCIARLREYAADQIEWHRIHPYIRDVFRRSNITTPDGELTAYGRYLANHPEEAR